ncbi:CPXCG motif-containing cysteine-rich protein [Polaribacter aquimarinus]|uniref:CPXCG motif-containing cysteine-rich protein n=1 Tax=Polaribacter aquimarinus TaxID=2100726 RepID=A0A2U2J7V1_9FLAO|nr:CPXCG motif-containing cysteine-rich protein [Polaribacter aquimarinus]PWG04418.1 CPXCG motif-containing cysteine-rich protein [Polaribacter aquimarinus]
MELEHFFQCPHCWSAISMILDASVSQQTYIEDCEICCNPIEITSNFEEGELVGFFSQSIEQ